MSNLMKSISWPQATVAVALVAGAVVASIFAPADVRTGLVGLLTALAAWLRVRQ